MQQQYRGDSCRDEQAHKDDRAPRYRVRHTRNMRPIKKAAIRKTIRIVTSMTANIAVRGGSVNFSYGRSAPPFWVSC
jgi:hypothetical protein